MNIGTLGRIRRGPAARRRAIYGVLGFLLLYGFHANAVGANDITIGVVDIGRVIEESPQRERIAAKLQDEFTPREAELKQLRNDVDKAEEALQTARANHTEADLYALRLDAVRRRILWERAQGEYEEDYELRRRQALATLHRLVLTEVVRFAKERGFDLILTEQAAMAGAGVDVTAAVLGRLKDKMLEFP